MPVRKSMRHMILLVFTLFVCLTVPQSASGETGEKTLHIIHTNDIHASFDEYGKVAAYIQNKRQSSDHFLYVDAGDFASGNPVVDLNNGKPMIDVFNLAGLDAFTIGNHEFDYGQDHLKTNMEQADFPWLAANLDTGATGVENTKPYVLIDADGISVALFSLTQAPPATAPANVIGMEFDNDYIGTALAYKDELESQADVIIALTHIGYDQDRRLANEVEYFDAIIGGHSHTTLNAPAVVNGTPIVQTGSNLQHIGELDFTYNETTDEVTEVSGQLTAVSSLTETDEDVQAVIDKYNEEMDELLGKVIGYSNTGLSRDGRYDRDAPLGNFWTDAMRAFADADIALTNNGGIRDSIAPGEVTLNDIYKIEPFANEIMVIEMTGEAIENVIAYSYARDDRNQIDLQTSGLHYEIITGMTGNFIDVNLSIDGQPLEADSTYKVAVADYIGTGGSGYHFEGEILQETVGLMTTAMEQYALERTAAGQALDYESEGRIALKVDPTAPNPGEIIGSTNTGLYSENKNKQDVGLGNLYADSIRAKTGSDFALLNSSSITGEIPPGSITDKQIEALDRYGNTIVVVETTGSRLKEVLLEQSRYHRGVDLQGSGLTYTLIPDENSVFNDVTILLENGEPLDLNGTYTVAYNDYMHASTFYNLGTAIDNSYGPVWQAVVDYVSTQTEPIDYTEGSRIAIEGKEPEDPTGTLTVAEAIANNSGTKAVKGYIVGSINNNRPIIGEGSHAPSNLLLADSPDETDRAKMLPVQLVNGTPVRNGLNLVNNPENIGKQVRITGSLETYFGTPGMRNPSTYGFIEEPVEPDPELPACDYKAWDKTAIYTAGDRVEHEGDFYEAKWWTQGENPAASGRWDVWKKATDCYEEPDGPQEWQADEIYTAGDRVYYEGQLYEAKWWTQGENPSESGQWDVWKKVTDSEEVPEGPQEWNATTIYVAGDRVLYEGRLYEAKWWTQGENPSESGQWDVWKKVSN
ncbi:5'-nucleotidase C-terminal domain-containing protein [Shouchella clausii]|uniref:5'-nucleotidase C-terminal domain-containing protein n=1 Tax=Shouchella clausii TaxID=79880 RepID=UPI000BA53AC9|nr:5'-nucleotidase C-terminal domain-containing protein [Shouchella clausii]PAE94062.1 multifunctional 2',3'-cyclic-nucleotide 2'-phosphodiesterase/5'-nucleotidase/3'-nucleotidase [Shouchella clausii]